jgi:hypothetical protein
VLYGRELQNGLLIVNRKKMEGIKIPFRSLERGTEENHKTSIRLFGLWAKILN